MPAPFPHLLGLHILHRTPPGTALSDSPTARRKHTQRQRPHANRQYNSAYPFFVTAKQPHLNLVWKQEKTENVLSKDRESIVIKVDID